MFSGPLSGERYRENSQLSPDALVRREISDRVPDQARRPVKEGFRNPEVERLYNESKTPEGLKALRSVLERGGAFEIEIKETDWTDTDGKKYTLFHPMAADTIMYPMGTNVWVRDIARIHAQSLFSGDLDRKNKGKEGLLSCLDFMSSVAQLKRFGNIIQSTDTEFAKDKLDWPYIFACSIDVIRDGKVIYPKNLNTEKTENWRHPQDAWQMLAYYTLEAVDKDLIKVDELSEKHKEFLASIVPFLVKVGFPNCENSGSWEELPAVRTSVMVWEHRLIEKLGEMTTRPGFEFLYDGFEGVKESLPDDFGNSSFSDAVNKLCDKASNVMEEQIFGGEAPGYELDDPRYREADAALFYALEIDYPRFLADKVCKTDEEKKEFEARAEQALVKFITSLRDPATGGIRRYQDDSYQGRDFFTPRIVDVMYKDGAEKEGGDAMADFVARGNLVPPGREAAWLHPVWQMAAWAGEKYIEARRDQREEAARTYLELHEQFFKNGLCSITGDGEVTLEVDENNSTKIKEKGPLKVPECIISVSDESGGIMYLPSPHTPLNWAVSEMTKAFDVRRRIVELQ